MHINIQIFMFRYPRKIGDSSIPLFFFSLNARNSITHNWLICHRIIQISCDLTSTTQQTINEKGKNKYLA